jgi:transposase InsO family protein
LTPRRVQPTVREPLPRGKRWLGIKIKRLLTNNGSAFRSKDFALAGNELGIRHKFTRPYRPQTNGKAERLIQSALREWAYGFTYQNSSERTAALDYWNHHYNWHRPIRALAALLPCLASI